jgi:hypothetical protein
MFQFNTKSRRKTNLQFPSGTGPQLEFAKQEMLTVLCRCAGLCEGLIALGFTRQPSCVTATNFASGNYFKASLNNLLPDLLQV